MFDINKLIGMTESDARSYIASDSKIARVVENNGKSFVGTCDYRLDRINLFVSGDKVYKFSVG